jgi:hypothetical protein
VSGPRAPGVPAMVAEDVATVLKTQRGA